jgi:uncharacterized membrane protein YesL
MIHALIVTARAFGLWWHDFVLFIFFNLSWLLLQLPIVTGPPATAAMYVIARRAADHELLDPRQGWHALRQMLVPAWKWGLVNLVIVVTVVGNFYFYQNNVGTVWTILRLVWGAIAVVWFALNLFYWPFWLAQRESDQKVLTTFRNSAVLLLKAPIFALTLVVLCALLIYTSLLLAIPLGAALMAWIALIGIVAVDEELQRSKAQHSGVEDVK